MEKKDAYNAAVSFRRHLHRYPEVSVQEFETQAYIVEVLEQYKIPCQTFGTGVIAILGKGGAMCGSACGYGTLCG